MVSPLTQLSCLFLTWCCTFSPRYEWHTFQQSHFYICTLLLDIKIQNHAKASPPHSLFFIKEPIIIHPTVLLMVHKCINKLAVVAAVAQQKTLLRVHVSYFTNVAQFVTEMLMVRFYSEAMTMKCCWQTKTTTSIHVTCNALIFCG
jgi:hypothetical protein